MLECKKIVLVLSKINMFDMFPLQKSQDILEFLALGLRHG